MKKLSLFFCGAFAVAAARAQTTPLYPLENLNIGSGSQTVTAPYQLFSPYQGAGPVLIYNTAQVDFVAGQRVRLGPGFHAGAMQGNGYFHAQIGATPDFDVVFIEPNQAYPQVGQFEKLELGLKLPASIEQQVASFINDPNTGINPFDPDQISVEAHFHIGNLNYTVYGFYYDEFIRDPAALQPLIPPNNVVPAHWIQQPTDYHWRIRFAPPLIGAWNCTIEIHLAQSPTAAFSVSNIRFNSVSSSNPGYLKVGNDQRHLAYSGTGSSFFAIGQNIAWNDQVTDNQGVDHVYFRGAPEISNGATLYHGGYLDILDWIQNLHDNGGNMVRVNTIGWNYELEQTHLNNYSDRLDAEWELDRLFELCESINMKIDFSFADRRFALENNPDDPSSNQPNPLMNWDHNPYHTQLFGIDYPDDFLTSPTAKNIFLKKLRYFIARYGYSTSLGILEPMGELNGGPYHDEAHWRDNMTDWFQDILAAAKNMTIYRSLLTSTSYAPPFHDNDLSPFYLGDLDLTSVHSYHNERGANIQRFLDFNEHGPGRKGTLVIWDYKPTFFQEAGITNQGDADPSDIDGCNDISYHNQLWATAFMGGFGTGLPWWQWFNNDYRQQNYPALNAFFSTLDFQESNFNDPDFWDNNDFILDPDRLDRHKTSELENFYIRDNSKNKAMGWIHNTTYWWGNISNNCVDREGDLMPPQSDDDSYNTPIEFLGYKVKIQGLINNGNYKFDLYHTRGSGGIHSSVNIQANILGALRPYWTPGEPDWAFKAYRAGNNFRESSALTYDTLDCNEDTVFAYGNYENDTLHNYSYHWDFGNGQTSDARNSMAVYVPGVYLVTLIVSNTNGWSDTLQQYLVKPDCENSRLFGGGVNEDLLSWRLFPNPARDQVNVVLDESWNGNVILELLSVTGECMGTFEITDQTTIPLSGLSEGIYFIRINNETRQSVKRLIKID